MRASRPHIVVKDLRIGWGSRVLMEHVNFEVERGTTLAILGGSGSGKSTLLRYLIGLEQPMAGRIDIDGVGEPHVYSGVPPFGVLFQSGALFSSLTLAENLALPLTTWTNVRGPLVQDFVQAKLDLVGLGAFTGRFPRQLSGGQQQRVALARALVIRPQILLLDEPLSNLDAKLREEMQIELRQIQRTVGTTTILVTHDQAEAMALSDRVVVMNHGRAEQIGPPHEAYERPATPFVANFLGRANLVNGATVRPEKMWFATSGLAGKVRTRIFQGNHWLYQIETAGGLVTVIRQNTGEAMPAEGEAVHLAWAAI